MPRAAGFTLIELVAVIATMGILMAVAAPRFFSANTFAARAFKDDAASFLRYAQKRAMARRGTVAVVAESSGLTLCAVAGATCDPANYLAGPSGDLPFRSLTPNDVILAASRTSVSFDAQGRPDAALTLTITGDTPHSISLEAETGYVH